MKVKTYFSTITFLIFFPPTEFLKKLVYIRIRLILVVTKNLKTFTNRKRKYWRTELETMKKSRTTRSHFTHASSYACETTGFHPDVFFVKKSIFPFDRFTGYKKSNQNQFGRGLPFAFALKCNRIYLLFSSLSDFDSFR